MGPPERRGEGRKAPGPKRHAPLGGVRGTVRRSGARRRAAGGRALPDGTQTAAPGAARRRPVDPRGVASGSGASRLPCTPGREGWRWSWAHARSLRRPTGLARTTFRKRDTVVGEEAGDWIRRDPRGPATSPLRGGGAGGDAWRVHSSRRYSRRVRPPRAWGRGSGTGHAGTQRAMSRMRTMARPWGRNGSNGRARELAAVPSREEVG
jgi:hypothetical protein